MAAIENVVLDQVRDIPGHLDRIETRRDDVTSRVRHGDRSVYDHAARFAALDIKFDRLVSRVNRVDAP